MFNTPRTKHPEFQPTNKGIVFPRRDRDAPGAFNLVIETCIACGQYHTHGIPEGESPKVGDVEHRACHCTYVDVDGGYFIEIVSVESEPIPSDWYENARRKNKALERAKKKAERDASHVS